MGTRPTVRFGPHGDLPRADMPRCSVKVRFQSRPAPRARASSGSTHPRPDPDPAARQIKAPTAPNLPVFSISHSCIDITFI